jgi:hypothetical protein
MVGTSLLIVRSRCSMGWSSAGSSKCSCSMVRKVAIQFNVIDYIVFELLHDFQGRSFFNVIDESITILSLPILLYNRKEEGKSRD